MRELALTLGQEEKVVDCAALGVEAEADFVAVVARLLAEALGDVDKSTGSTSSITIGSLVDTVGATGSSGTDCSGSFSCNGIEVSSGVGVGAGAFGAPGVGVASYQGLPAFQLTSSAAAS